jgi:hypothetical protein
VVSPLFSFEVVVAPKPSLGYISVRGFVRRRQFAYSNRPQKKISLCDRKHMPNSFAPVSLSRSDGTGMAEMSQEIRDNPLKSTTRKLRRSGTAATQTRPLILKVVPVPSSRARSGTWEYLITSVRGLDPTTAGKDPWRFVA